jgi:hypothetical protein
MLFYSLAILTKFPLQRSPAVCLDHVEFRFKSSSFVPEGRQLTRLGARGGGGVERKHFEYNLLFSHEDVTCCWPRACDSHSTTTWPTSRIQSVHSSSLKKDAIYVPGNEIQFRSTYLSS